MAFDLHACSPPNALDALANAIDAAKGGDRLASVTVVVPTNVAGVMARRALGRGRGILGVDMVTLNRLAELLAGPGLAQANRQPTSTPLLDLTVRKVLDEAPGHYAAVAGHPATVTALRNLHRELRMVGDRGTTRLTSTSSGREAVRVSAAVTRLLRRRWYDEADLLVGATGVLRSARPLGLDRVVLYLPHTFEPLALDFVHELARESTVSLVITLTGNNIADAEPLGLIRSLGLGLGLPSSTPPDQLVAATPRRIVETTDADDEVRVAVRAIVDAARGSTLGAPVPFERMAIVWPTHRPYARLVEHHLSADGIAWNGRGGIELAERIAPRLLLDLLDVDRRGLRRLPLFQLLADVPTRDTEGRLRRTAEWERVSRAAGISRDDDWIPRLSALTASSRWSESATSLLDFIRNLRTVLGHPQATRSWSGWVEWCIEQLENWLSKATITHLSDAEYRAWEALMSALERLRCLDEVAEPVNRHQFRTVLAGELDEATVRDGRIGAGVTIGSLASASGLDIDVAVVLGVADGLLPPSPTGDPLLSAADRERAGLAPAEQRACRLHHEFIALTQATHTIVTLPRGDLRTAASHQISRWLDHIDPTSIEVIDSSAAALMMMPFAPCERERRLSDRLRSVTVSGAAALAVGDDPIMTRNLAMQQARSSPGLTAYDGDLSEAGIANLAVSRDELDALGRKSISPTQIKAWTSCPHGYFVEYLLGVRPVDEPDRKISIDARDRGNVQHDTLDAFHRDVIEGRLPQPTEHGWTDVHRTALLTHFTTCCDAAGRAGRTGRPATWASERIRMRADVLRWFDRDSQISQTNRVTVLASEREFPRRETTPNVTGSTTAADAMAPTPVTIMLPDGRMLAMRGKIDRLDRRGDGTLVVTDHKTGDPKAFRKLSTDDPTLGGAEFQLAAYAAAALAWHETGAISEPPVRAEYSMFEKGDYQRFGLHFDDEVWERVQHDLGRIVDGIEAGWFPQIPAPPGFKLYTPCLYCAPDELDTDASFDRWAMKRDDTRISRWFADDARGDVDVSEHDDD
jgi:ATP-dependent helicase/nuclease subunit B